MSESTSPPALRNSEPATRNSELSLAGAALVAGAEQYLLNHKQATVTGGGDAFDAWLQKQGQLYRGMAEQLQYVPAASTAHLLQQAIAILERDGWIRGSYHGDRGHCLTGALEAAAKESGFAWEVHKAAELAATLALSFRAGTPNLIGWNDNLGRTASEVVELLAAGVAVARRLGGGGDHG